MSVNGWGSYGAGGFGPSKVWLSLPYLNYRSLDPWVEEFIDALGGEFDILEQRYISATARANLLDPTRTPTEVADAYHATATAAPLAAVSTDTMLDVLLYLALGIYPADTNLTVAQKQSLVQTGWNALRRKGNRQRLLELASKISDGVAVGWTVPPFNFSIILPDGTPAPGWGPWVQPTNATAETSRPWVLNGIRNSMASITPSFINLGVGFSQFRAGYSSAGETVFPASSRINLLANEHFTTWSIGVPTSWTKTGTATLTQSTAAAAINWEFTGSAAVLDLTSTGIGNSVGLSQLAAFVNDQLTHRLQIDYAYTNTQNVSVLTLQVTDANRDGSTYYWNPTTSAWSTTVTNIAIPPSSTRGRFAIDVVPQSSSSTATAQGTTAITVAISAKYDGTSTTATTYTLYRVGLYEKFNLAIEQAALGERTLWQPLVDAPGWSTANRTVGTGSLLEMANATRSSYKLVNSSTGASFPYHPALSGRGYRAHGTWVNIVKDSNGFTAGTWTTTNGTATANAVISPIVGESVASAAQLTATSTAGQIKQQVGTVGINPANKTYVGGVWVKKMTADVSTVRVELVSVSTFTTTYTLTQAQGWQLLPIQVSLGGTETSNLNFQIRWANASATASIAVADAYLYDVTSNTGVLYPPVIRSSGGVIATLNASLNQALTSTQNTNVLHPLTQRTQASVVRGDLGVVVVPTYDASSQPNGVIFDLAQNATTNRVALRVASGALELRRWDGGGNQWVTSLTLTSSPSPAAGSMTWLRDTAITVRAIWDENATQLSAGNANATPGTKPGSWVPSDATVAAVGLGNDWQSTSANQFDGHVTAIAVDQIGAPTT